MSIIQPKTACVVAATVLAMVAHADRGLTARRYYFAPHPGLLEPIGNLLGHSTWDVWVWDGPLIKPHWGVNYSMTWEGVVAIEATDTYSFGTRSDDGSVIYIDIDGDGDYADPGEFIVNNNRWQGATDRTGSVTLTGGRQYRIVIGYYQGGGGAEMNARWRRGSFGGYWDQNVLDTSAGPFRTRFGPVVDHGDGATNVAGDSAVLRVNLNSATNTASASAMVYWGPTDGATTPLHWANSHTWPAPRNWGVMSHAIGGLTSNAVYYYRAFAADAATNMWAAASSAWITAPVSVAKIQDASEVGRQQGLLRFSRPAAVAAPALDVRYTVGGAAVPGVNYTALAGTVRLPAGATSADVTVIPLNDWRTQHATTVTVAVAEGPYIVGAGAVQLAIFNEALPDAPGTNIWIGSGNASVAANWSKGRIPTADETVWLGAFSTSDMRWDAPNGGLPDTVAGWWQDAGYTGTATIPTTYPRQSTNFTQLVVNGDMRLDGGTLAHPGQPRMFAATYRLCVRVTGNLRIAAAATISANSRGYTGGDDGGPGSVWRPNGATSVAAHGGFSGLNANGGQSSRTYGSVFAPFLPGSKGQADPGGGAIWLDVDGATHVDGAIAAMGGDTKWGAGSGGSIRLRSATLAGSGAIRADGGQGIIPGREWEGWGPNGGGGRVAVKLTAGNATGSVAIWARGGALWSYDRRGGPGTVYLQMAGQPDGAGSVRIDNDWRSGDERSRSQLPPSVSGAYWGDGEESTPAEDFSRTALELRNRGFLELTANLRARAASVDGSSRLFLGGHTLTVAEFRDGGNRLIPGIYTAGQLSRVSGAGSVIVLSAGTVIILR